MVLPNERRIGTMKYLWNNVVYTEDELRELYLKAKPESSEIAFGFWLYFKVEQGVIKEVEK
jgi:hypothetical protein